MLWTTLLMSVRIAPVTKQRSASRGDTRDRRQRLSCSALILKCDSATLLETHCHVLSSYQEQFTSQQRFSGGKPLFNHSGLLSSASLIGPFAYSLFLYFWISVNMCTDSAFWRLFLFHWNASHGSVLALMTFKSRDQRFHPQSLQSAHQNSLVLHN